MAVRFLEADPRFFRSGYIKADLIRHVRKAQLSNDQRIRLRRVILIRIQGQDAREFRSYCHLARAVADADFERQVVEFAASPVSSISRKPAGRHPHYNAVIGKAHCVTADTKHARKVNLENVRAIASEPMGTVPA
jgi:hypothetical protein